MNNIIWNDGENEFKVELVGGYDIYEEYLITIRCGIFSGGNYFCETIEDIKLIEKINIDNLAINDVIMIADADSDSHIKFTVLDNLGKIIVSGSIGGSHRNNYMRFKFIADQTILQNLINLFKYYHTRC